MQPLTSAPVAASPTPSMATGVPYAPPPQPRLGTPIPGTTGGLPAQSGLSVFQNPMAQQLQSMGRGQDTQLVHMTPREVQSLRGLAQLTGGDLTTNPDTGLPEAGWLGNLLPTILGGLATVLTGGAIAPWMAGLAGAVGGTAATGSLSKGLMMGLGAFGGAGLGSAIKGLGATAAGGAGGAANIAVNPAVTSAAAPAAATAGQAAQLAALPGAIGAAPVTSALTNSLAALPGVGATTAGAGALVPSLGTIAGGATPAAGGIFAGTAGTAGGEVAKQQLGLLGGYKEATNLPFLGKMGATIGPVAGGLGVLNALSPTPGKMKDEEEKTNFPYRGPLIAKRERLPVEPIDLRGPNPSAQRQYFGGITFTDSGGNPYVPGTPTATPQPYYSGSTPMSLGIARQGASLVQPDRKPGETMEQYMLRVTMGGYAKGGEMPMDEGSFIFPARETAEIGNGSSRAGQEVLARLGGRAIDGKGDGVSDSIRARIGGKQEARVARDEVYFSPNAVARIGGGDHQRGTKKLYAMMDKARNARKRAAIGADTQLRKGLV